MDSAAAVDVIDDGNWSRKMFDDVIKSVRKWFDQNDVKSGTEQIRMLKIPAGEDGPQQSADRSRNPANIILKEDTQLELGHPSAGSVNAVLTTRNAELVNEGCITLVGPDIKEADQETLPFAQIVFACCRDEVEQTPFILDRLLHHVAQTDGYMIRSVPNLVWARVSKDAFQSGLSLFQIGERMLNAIRRDCKEVDKAEIFFVTRRREDIFDLDKMLQDARSKLQKLRTFVRSEEGDYECTTNLDCEECEEQEVCDTIRDVIKIRKGDRIISLGMDGDQ